MNHVVCHWCMLESTSSEHIPLAHKSSIIRVATG
jgi:hypothetical protein